MPPIRAPAPKRRRYTGWPPLVVDACCTTAAPDWKSLTAIAIEARLGIGVLTCRAPIAVAASASVNPAATVTAVVRRSIAVISNPSRCACRASAIRSAPQTGPLTAAIGRTTGPTQADPPFGGPTV